MTRNWPPCWQTKRRPSGENSIAVPLAMPLATTDSLNPEGREAAKRGPAMRARKAPAISCLSLVFMIFCLFATEHPHDRPGFPSGLPSHHDRVAPSNLHKLEKLKC